MSEQVLSGISLTRRFPWHGWAGLGLIAIFWPLNWLLSGLRTHLGFFPLWLGFCLAVDALNVYRTDTSLFTRNRRRYIALFLISIPLWWVFELLNWRTQNWIYLGREHFSALTYGLLASLSFSTVVPAVLGSAELFAGFNFVRRLRPGPVVSPERRLTMMFFSLGWVMLLLLIAWPRLFFPFLWLFIYFLLAPVNVWLGHRSLSEWTQKGDWRPVVALWLGVLLCAFFWEMWNVFSHPKWVYSVPYLGFWHIFEMPFFGYFGYLPFALELFAMVHLVLGLFDAKDTDYVTQGLVIDPNR